MTFSIHHCCGCPGYLLFECVGGALAANFATSLGLLGGFVCAAYLLFGLMVPPLRRLTFGRRPKSKQKVLPLASGSRCARLPSFHHCSRGPPRRAIPGPSRLSRHPCRSTPYATIPLGLLMGRLASSVPLRFDDQKQNHRFLMGIAALHPSYESAAIRRSGLGRDASAVALFLLFALPSTNCPNNAVPESRQEAEWRWCGEGRLAWMPNEACRAMDGPSRRPSEQHRSEGS